MEEYRQLAQLIDYATAESMPQPDQQAFIAVADVIRSRADIPKEAIKCFSKRLATKNTKILMLTLELMEFSTFACEINLHNQYSTKDFLLRLGSILNQKDIEEIVKKRLLAVIQTWHGQFQRDLHQLFFGFYDNVKVKGFDIPSSYESNYRTFKKSQLNSSSSNNNNSSSQSVRFDEHPTSSYDISPQKPSRSVGSNSNKPSHQSNQHQPQLSSKLQKLKDNIDIMKQNIQLVNELIDSHPVGTSVEENDSLIDLANSLSSRVDQLQGLIGTLEDEFMLQYTIQVNDDLIKTLERFKYLRKGKKPPAFNDNQVEEEVLQQIRLMEVQEKMKAIDQFNNIQSVSKPSPIKPQFGQSQFNQPQQNKPQQQQVEQPVVQQQKPQAMVENLIDLLGDDEPPVVVQKPPQNNNNNANNANNSVSIPLDLFDDGPQVKPVVQNNNINPQQSLNPNNNNQINFQQLQQSQQQKPFQSQPPAQQFPQPDKYSALEQLTQPPMNPYQMGMGGSGYPNPNFINPNQNMMYQQNQMAFSQQQQPRFPPNNGMGMNMSMQQPPFNNGFPPNNNINNGFPPNNNNMMFSQPPVYSQPPMNYGNSAPLNFNNNNNNNFKPNYSASTGISSNSNNNINNKPQPAGFDDLDDMFGIQLPSKGGQKTQTQQKPPQQQQQQQQQQQSTGSTIDDLF